MFAGNMGEAQDFEHIMEAALQLSCDENIHFVILGSGRKLQWTEYFVAQHQLESTVHLLGRYPVEMMPAFFQRADVMLISLKDISIFNLTVPAKLQAYMGAGKPILAMMNGEGPHLIAEASCGLSVPAGDSAGLAHTVKKMAMMDKQQLHQMGVRGKEYQLNYFQLDKCMQHLESMLV